MGPDGRRGRGFPRRYSRARFGHRPSGPAITPAKLPATSHRVDVALRYFLGGAVPAARQFLADRAREGSRWDPPQGARHGPSTSAVAERIPNETLVAGREDRMMRRRRRQSGWSASRTPASDQPDVGHFAMQEDPATVAADQRISRNCRQTRLNNRFDQEEIP